MKIRLYTLYTLYTQMLIRWLDGSFEEIDAKTDEQAIEILKGRVGRNQVVQIIHNTHDDHETFCNFRNVLITPERKMTDQECRHVESVFEKKWECATSFEIFRQLIVDNQAIVAGGAIVNAFLDKKINDFDVYIHHKHRISFVTELLSKLSMMPNASNIYAGSTYDKSFFSKNHILLRVPLFKASQNLSVDVIIVPDEIPLETVVTNFDLTFCESWWDGHCLYSADPHGLRHREGWLKPSYRDRLFVDLNMFTIKRIRKYRHRGFTVHLSDDSSLNEVSFDQVITGWNNEDNDSKNEENDKEAQIVRYFLHNFIRFIVNTTFETIHYRQKWMRNMLCILTCVPNEFNLKSLQSSIPEDLLKLAVTSIFRNRHEYTPTYVDDFPQLFQFDMEQQNIVSDLRKGLYQFGNSLMTAMNMPIVNEPQEPHMQQHYEDFWDF